METIEFRADIQELLNLIIHAFYSSQDIFLRELISNASDALDKLRIENLQNGVVDYDYRIRILSSPDEKTLMVTDTGIGMNKDDIIHHLSTIARSGTKDFLKKLGDAAKDHKDDLIGQFGVGFFSSFLVAKKVEVISRKHGDDKAYRWTSDASSTYTIEEYEDHPENGTIIKLYLKEDSLVYADTEKLKKIVNEHSRFITYPIFLWEEKEEEIPVEDESETGQEESEDAAVEESDKPVVEEVESADETKQQEKKTEKRKYWDWEKINGDVPTWYKNPKDVEEKEYEELYKNISKNFDKPLVWKHFRTEGAYEFRGVLFIPERAPFELFGEANRDRRNIRLYSKKVLILEHLEKDMIPDWMNFVVGVIDSSDLPLNVSREMLQQTRVVTAMKNQLKKQITNMIQNLYEEDKTKYQKFYEAFQKNIKLGIHEGNQDLMELLIIHCDSVTESPVTLKEYVETKMQPNQKEIYYMTGKESEQSVVRKAYTDKGYHVLLFTEPIDDFMLQRVSKYKEYDLINTSKDHLPPWAAAVDTPSEETDEDKKEETKEESQYKALLEFMKETLKGENVEDVRESKTIRGAKYDPLYVLSSKFGWTGNMEKLMKHQPLNDTQQMMWLKSKRIVELNIEHPIVLRLQGLIETDKPQAEQLVRLLYDAGMLSSGFPIDDPIRFSTRIFESLNATATTTT